MYYGEIGRARSQRVARREHSDVILRGRESAPLKLEVSGHRFFRPFKDAIIVVLILRFYNVIGSEFFSDTNHAMAASAANVAGGVLGGSIRASLSAACAAVSAAFAEQA